MEPIQRSLRAFANRPGFKERYDMLKQTVMNDPDVQAFISEHEQQLNRDMIERSLVKLYEFVEQKKDCSECPSARECKNIFKGHWPRLFISGSRIDIQYETCQKQRREEERQRQQRMLQSMYMPKEVLRASFDDFDFNNANKEKMEAFKAALNFARTYQKEHFQKGLYLYGKFGVGKTYLLGALANELADRDVSSMLVYVPEFLREIKGSLQDGTLDKKLEVVKTAEILMLDDIGAESVSSWVRDEVLGTILQYRMMEKLPTFFASNASFSELEHHLTYTQRGEVEQLKAARIMERIKYLAKPMPISGTNYRDLMTD
ncbi:primosomal protein DnaI [Bacillus tianshenii]|nr:primosomal protein DnaI [Bacillus tianshenii]